MSFVFINGQILPESEAKISVFDHGLLYGDGIYDSLRAYKNQIWNYEAHIQRFFEGAESLKICIPYTKEEIHSQLTKLLELNNHPESRIRIYISRGTNNYNFSDSKNPTFIMTAIPIPVFPKDMGKLITIELERPFPNLKSSSLIITNIARQLCEQNDAVDALLIDRDSHLTEGSICNYFVVINNTLITPTEKNLPGTTQNLVMKLAEKLKIPFQTRKIKHSEIPTFSEIFITSVFKHVLPISHIDNTPVANASPGPISLKLQSALAEEYQKFTQNS